MADNDDHKNYKAIKMGIQDIVKNRKFHRQLTQLVKQCSKIAILGALNIHTKAYTWTREGNDAMLNAMFGGKFFAEPYFREVYNKDGPLYQDLAQRGIINGLGIEILHGHGQVIYYLAQDYKVNFANNVIFRHQRWIKMVYTAYRRMHNMPDPDETEMSNAVKYLCFEPSTDVGPDVDFIQFLESQFGMHIDGQGFFENIKEDWSTFVPFFVKCQLYVYQWNKLVDEQIADAVAAADGNVLDDRVVEIQRRSLKLFTVIPQLSWKRKHITLDTRSLKQILNVNKAYGSKYPETDFLAFQN